MIFVLVGFVVGFAAGAITNEVQSKKQNKKVSTEESKQVNSEDISEEKAVPSVTKTETKSSYTNYTNVDDINKEPEILPKYEHCDKTMFEEHEAEGLSSEYESVDLYFNLATGVCSDEDKEPVNSWESLVGPDIYTELSELVGQSYEGLPISKKVFYVINNDVDTYFRISVFQDIYDV